MAGATQGWCILSITALFANEVEADRCLEVLHYYNLLNVLYLMGEDILSFKFVDFFTGDKNCW